MKKSFVQIGLLFFLPFLLAPLALTAQQKISMSDAIMKGRTVLAPSNLKQLQWIPGTTQFTHVVDNRLVRVQAPGLKTDTLDILDKINTGLTGMGVPVLGGFPAITWVNNDLLTFSNNNEMYTYSLTQGLQRKNGYPADADNLDVHDKTYAAAYTRKDGLWVNAN